MRHLGPIPFLLVLFVAASAPAQPPATSPTPASVLTKLQARYRSAPTCERIQIEVKSDSGRSDRSWALIRINPKPEPSILIELGQLRIAADSKSLSAVHIRNPQTCFTANLPGDGPLTPARVAKVIPPVPIAPLDLLLSDDLSHLPSLAVYAREVNWSNATPDPRQPARVTLEGQSDRGKVVLVARGDQIQSLDLRDEPRAVTIRMTFTAVAPCRVEDIRLDTAGRTHVDQLSDLQPRGGVLRTGAAIPELQLSTSAGQFQKLKELFTPPAQFLPAPEADRLLLVFTRRAKSDPAQTVHCGRIELPALAREIAKIQAETYQPPDKPNQSTEQHALEQGRPLLPTFNFAQVAVLDTPSADALLALIKHERESWSDHFAWTTEAKSSVDLFSTSGESLAIILDQQQRLRAVVPISDHTTTEELLDQLTASLIETSGDSIP